MPSLLSRKGGFAMPGKGKTPEPAKSDVPKGKGGASLADAKADKQRKVERKDKDEVTALKDRLAKGHRLNDTELAQLELAAVARWNQLQREDDEEIERQREAEREKEELREQRLNQELKELRSAAAADRANLERAGAAVADELRELRELRDAAAADRAMLETSVADELTELRAMRVQAAREQARRDALSAEELALENQMLTSIYNDTRARSSSPPAQRGETPARAIQVASASPVPTMTNMSNAPADCGSTLPVPYVAAAAAGEAARGRGCSNEPDTTSSENTMNTNLHTPPKKPAAKKKAPAPAMDYETMVRLAAFDDWAAEQTRKTEKKGFLPLSRAQLEAQWMDIAGPIRARYEREAAQKLQRAGFDSGDAAGLKPGQCSRSMANPMAASMHDDDPAASGGKSRARVDFGRTPKKPDAPPRKRRGLPPDHPTNSLWADVLSLTALSAIASLLITRSWLCRTDDFFDSLSGFVPSRFAGARMRRQLWGEKETTGSAALKATIIEDYTKASAAAVKYGGVLASELSASCGQMTSWSEPGSGLLHLVTLLVAITLFVTLLRHLHTRIGSALAARAQRVDGMKKPLLPVDANASDGLATELPAMSYAPWTSVACAELLVASYSARLFVSTAAADAGYDDGGTITLAAMWVWVGGGSSSSAAHTFVIVCSGALLFAAGRRGMQMFWYGRAYKAWMNAPTPKPLSALKPPPKVAPAERAIPVPPKRGAGRQPAKAPPIKAPQKSFLARCLPCLDGGAPTPAPKEEAQAGRCGVSAAKKGPVGRGSAKSMV